MSEAALRQTGASPLRPVDPYRIGPYVPIALLGNGGMGRVYLACPTDGSPGLVAVKVIRPEYADDPGFRRRFEREASLHERVRTAHAPKLCGAGFQDELLWMATEYLPGLNLADAVRELGALDTAVLWRLVAELGQALADLAAAQIVHRDLKPSNVLMSVRGAHLIDFGISKAVDASNITGTGIRVGTPAYMSPEHLRTGQSDTASDVFSLAGTLVYAAVGRPPFGDGTGVDVMHRVAFEEPDSELIAEITAADAVLGSLLTACLAKEPERRPTGQDLIDTATVHTATTVWPEPLAGQLLARQRAYETLHRLPAASRAVLRSRDVQPRAMPAPAEPAGRPVPPALEAPEVAADPAPTTPPARPQENKAGARVRKRLLWAIATGIAVCAVTAGVLWSNRHDAPPTASAPGTDSGSASGRTAGHTVPGGTAVSPKPGASDAKAASGKSMDGAADPNGVSGSADNPGSAETAARGTPSAPGADPVSAASDDTTPSSSPSTPPSTEPATPAWISDCTYYSGNKRTIPGDTGQRVLQVQCMLAKRGYDIGSTGVDGDFGDGTESAVLSFQSDKLLAVNGIVNHKTWLALRSTE